MVGHPRGADAVRSRSAHHPDARYEPRVDKLTPMLCDHVYKACRARPSRRPAFARPTTCSLDRAHRRSAGAFSLRTRCDTPVHRERTRAPLCRVPTPAEVNKLLTEADPDLSLFLRLAILTGARRGELSALHWLEPSTTRALPSAARSTPRRVCSPRSCRSPASSAVSISTPTLLSFWLHDSVPRRGARRPVPLGRASRPSAYIFSDEPDGSRPWRPDGKAYSVLRKKVGLEHVRLHDLRHASATWQFAVGIAPHIISARLGHASKAMTFDVYGHARTGDGQGAASARGDARRLGGSGEAGRSCFVYDAPHVSQHAVESVCQDRLLLRRLFDYYENVEGAMHVQGRIVGDNSEFCVTFSSVDTSLEVHVKAGMADPPTKAKWSAAMPCIGICWCLSIMDKRCSNQNVS